MASIYGFSLCANSPCTVYSFGAHRPELRKLSETSLHLGPAYITRERRVLRELGPIYNNRLKYLASRERHDLVYLRRMASAYILATSEIPVLQ